MTRVVVRLGGAGLVLMFAVVSVLAETTYTQTVREIVEKRCVSCHGKDAAPEYYAYKQSPEGWKAKNLGMRMDTYSHLIFYTAWPDTGALMRRLDDGTNTKDEKPGNMYVYLGDTEDERRLNLKLMKDWVGNWTLKRWPDITKEEMTGIKVKY